LERSHALQRDLGNENLGNENAADTPDGSDQQADGGLAAFAPAL
jgi:hypothetical protein